MRSGRTTVRPLSVRSFRSRVPSSRRRTVGLSKDGQQENVLPENLERTISAAGYAPRCARVRSMGRMCPR